VETAPPRFGENNHEVLSRLGFTNEEIAAFGQSGVISGAV
jgi:crotonobetainyl-CoA:carnitine CoA-transferase CaiB-like acyl-CoA transferase